MPTGTDASDQTSISETLGDLLRVSPGVTIPASLGIAGMAAGLLPLGPASVLLMFGGMAGGLALSALDDWLGDPSRSATTRNLGKTAMTVAGVASAAALAATLAVVAPATLAAAAAVAGAGLVAFGVSKLVNKFRADDAAEKAVDKAPAKVGRVAAVATAAALAVGVAVAFPVAPVVGVAAGAAAAAVVKAAADTQTRDEAVRDQEVACKEQDVAADDAVGVSDQDRSKLARRIARRVIRLPFIFPVPGVPFIIPIPNLPPPRYLLAGGRTFSGLIGEATRSAARAGAERAGREAASAVAKSAIEVASEPNQAPVQGINDSLQEATSR